MIDLRITYENGDQVITRFNGSYSEARNYYLGHIFNLGVETDNLQRCVSIEQFKNGNVRRISTIAPED